MKKLEVIAEFIDSATGKRVLPAAPGAEPVTFTPRDDDQAIRLTYAGCLREPRASAPKPVGPDYVAHKLFDLDLGKATKDQLLVIAAYEEVDVPQGDKATVAELRSAIEAKRKAS